MYIFCFHGGKNKSYIFQVSRFFFTELPVYFSRQRQRSGSIKSTNCKEIQRYTRIWWCQIFRCTTRPQRMMAELFMNYGDSGGIRLSSSIELFLLFCETSVLQSMNYLPWSYLLHFRLVLNLLVPQEEQEQLLFQKNSHLNVEERVRHLQRDKTSIQLSKKIMNSTLYGLS